MQKKWRVAVLAGGFSHEHVISRYSGLGVHDALQEGGHYVLLFDPKETPVCEIDWKEFDVAFIALHGCYGEDGQVQRELEELGVPYTGSGVDASLLAFHKAATKLVLQHEGIPTPKFEVLQFLGWPALAEYPSIYFPLVLKPECDGSSYGITLLESSWDYERAYQRAFYEARQVLVEEACTGNEWTVPLLDDMVLPPIQISTPRDFFDYEAKYLEESTTYEVATDLESPLVKTLSNLALRTAKAVGTRGLSRVDIRYDAIGNPQVLEINTIPGMTSHSLVPKSAAAIGWSFTELCERAIESALRHSNAIR